MSTEKKASSFDAAPARGSSTEHPVAECDASTADGDVGLSLPVGWKYKSIRLGLGSGSWSLPWYASPPTQLLMVSFVCFLCPGMFNALGGLGGGGKTDATLADNMVSYISPVKKTTPQGARLIRCSEHSLVQHLCRFRFLRRHVYKQTGSQVHAGIWRHWVLPVRWQLVGIRPR